MPVEIRDYSNITTSGFTTSFNVGDILDSTALTGTIHYDIVKDGDLFDGSTTTFVIDETYRNKKLTLEDNNARIKLRFTANGTSRYGNPISREFNAYVSISVTSNTPVFHAILTIDAKQSYSSGELFSADNIVSVTVRYSVGDGRYNDYVLKNNEHFIVNGIYKKTGENTYSDTDSIGNTVSTGNYRASIKINGTDYDTPIYAVSIIPNEYGKKTYKVIDSEGTFYIIPSNENNTSNAIGYITLGDRNKNENAKVVLTNDLQNQKTENITSFDNNVTITFPSYASGLADKVNHCTFGKVFNNQLFLSGNADFPNTDYHSSPVNLSGGQEETNDLTYFSDLDYCNYGNNDTKVVGYDTYRDGDLVVFKQDSKYQATLYRRTATLIQATNYEGKKVKDNNENILYETHYPSYEINTNGGEGALNYRSIANLLGSTLFLSKNGVKLLSSKETTYNNARYTYDVSSNINYALKGTFSENDKLYAFKEKLFLITEKGVFMAFNGIATENELEWFPIDLGFIPTMMFELDDEIYFANQQGGIYRFNNDEYYYNDRDVVVYGEGNLIENNGTLPYAIKKDNRVYITTGTRIQLLDSNKNYYYNFLCLISSIRNNGMLKVSASNEYFADGVKMYFYKESQSGYHLVTLQQKYNEFDTEYNYFYLINEDGQTRSLESITAGDALYVRLDETNPTFIDQIEVDDDDYIDISIVDGHGNRIFIPSVNEGNIIIYNEKPVEAYYKTKTFDFGTTVYEKTIWGFVLANDSGLKSETSIGYINSRKQNDFNFEADASQFNLEDFKFDSIQFDNDGLPHVYSKYKVIPRVSFIRFLFKNEGSTNLVLSELSMLYSVSRLTRGIK